MYNLIQIEQYKITRRLLYWILLVMNLMFNAAFIADVWFTDDRPIESMMWPSNITGGLEVAQIAGPMLLVILIGATTGQSYVWRTSQQMLARGTSRLRLALSAFAGFVMPAFVGLMLSSIVIQLINAVIFTWVNGGSVDLFSAEWGTLAQGTLIIFAMLLAYGALTFLVAVATRSTVAAVSAGLMMVLFIENLWALLASQLGRWAEVVLQHLPGQLNNALVERLTSDGSAESIEALSSVLSTPHAAVAQLSYIVLGVVFAYLALRRQDLA